MVLRKRARRCDRADRNERNRAASRDYQGCKDDGASRQSQPSHEREYTPKRGSSPAWHRKAPDAPADLARFFSFDEVRGGPRVDHAGTVTPSRDVDGPKARAAALRAKTGTLDDRRRRDEHPS
jgi:hypothetical protein